MSRISQILLFVGLVFLVLWFVSVRALSGGLLPFVWVLLGLGVSCIVGVIVKDFNFFVELAGQRTTKHGLNLGALVVIIMVILVGLNFIGFQHAKKYDVTKERVHSLSEQSKTVLGALKGDVMVRGFFTDNNDGGAGQQKFKDLIELYSSYSKNVKSLVINPVKKPEEAKAYDVTSNGSVVFEYLGKKTKVDDITEQGFTNAFIKITRDKNKIIYFITGHGERDSESVEIDGAQNLKKYLSESSYDVKSLSFIDQAIVPEDAAVVVIAGPKQPYLEPEIKAVKDYLFKGGKLLLALDPGNKNNLSGLAKTIGVEFKNNFILDQMGMLVGAGGATAVGISYSPLNDITKNFKQAMTIFHLASQVKVYKDKPDAVQVEEIVKSSPASFAKTEIKQGEAKFIPGKDEKGPLTIMISTIGKLRKESDSKGEAQEFSAVVVGDSDFFSNQLIDAQLNHDLILNSVAYLAKDKELVSIRPRQSEGTALTITQTQSTILYYSLVFILPLLIFSSGGIVWYRRRSA